MSVAVSEYPTNGNLVRGDPIDIAVTIQIDGDPADLTGWTWRSQIRTTPDGTVVATFDVNPGAGPGELVLHLDDTDSALLNGGEVFDLEQLTPIHRTWWIVSRLNITRDVSRTDP